MKHLASSLFTTLMIVVAAPSYAEVPPQEVVAMTTNSVMSEVRRQHDALAKNPQQLYRLVNKQLIPLIDFNRMSRWTLGKHWRRATPDQRKRFTEQFKTMLVRTYANALLEFSNNRITYLPMAASPGATDVTVRTVVHLSGGPSIPVSYSLHLKDKKWLAYDINIDGISLIANYRSSFASQMRRDDLDTLISMLEKRNHSLIK
ncbi:MAG: ABC transporter substrate-binding protein [Gammaproteobacteria bacterium]|nr:MAG: ABC transporter substrate-binding protein [Gammaproteobacteria bacterium]